MKSEIFAPLVPGIMKASGHTEQKVREVIDSMTISELLATYDYQLKLGQLQPYLSAEQIENLQKFVHLEKAEDEILQVKAKAAAERAVFELRRHESLEPQRQAQLEADRRTLADAARTLNFGVTEANFNVTRSLLGPGFTVYTIQQAIDSNALLLSAPSQEELDKWHAERVKAHNEFLRNADVETLKRLTREAGQRRTQTTMDQVQAVRAAEREMNQPVYEPLTPESRFQGQPITKQLLWRLDKQHARFLVEKYGASQLTARINGKL